MGNKYVLILVIFTVWMVFFDTNSWFIHKELNDEIDKLKGNRAYFKQEIRSDRNQINKLKDSEELERFAREEYLMKKENEEIFIIEFEDSLKTDKDG
ncbi:septum formation initiator [Leeuwenhoekiella aestuarii]|uniref:Septum formation initiator n=1 Tax=Leeuwenhoekiella aestuarii TaxID=2249426 RepID=A0A4Q0NUY9_9FLAO|nr:septum formation initiator family protein [Leeuwenhoekiella aestuarii]RXG15338.1 septum formation initiator [Leeuwenhoekiella aestuarii]